VDATPSEPTVVSDPPTEPPPAAGESAPGPAPAPAAVEPAPSSAPGDARGEHGARSVALLLGAAAVLAAIVGARAAALTNEAGDAWQEALRTETKRAAAALQDTQVVYSEELQPALQVVEARLLRDEMEAAAAATSGAVARALRIEAEVQAAVIDTIEPTSELATAPEYALPAGGVDLGRRLADARAAKQDVVALDPDAVMAAGDARAGLASAMMLALLPVSIAALLGALAQPFARRRRLLLGAGLVALGTGAAVAVAVELLG
jgi:hypothetical protein